MKKIIAFSFLVASTLCASEQNDIFEQRLTTLENQIDARPTTVTEQWKYEFGGYIVPVMDDNDQQVGSAMYWAQPTILGGLETLSDARPSRMLFMQDGQEQRKFVVKSKNWGPILACCVSGDQLAIGWQEISQTETRMNSRLYLTCLALASLSENGEIDLDAGKVAYKRKLLGDLGFICVGKTL
ncbi:MAG: hypothetical protein ACHQIM_23010 [Sphingobacteriales bacterium]